jgi:hypothetical protein
VGNAKNAGKTTVLNALLEAFSDHIVGVTSVGLDGEELDAVTYLPKPRIHMRPGTLFATAERCLESSSATWRLRSRTGIATALGEVVVADVLTAGDVLVGGPSTAASTAMVVAELKRNGAERVFLDGAFARMSHAAAGDAMVYVVGAHGSVSMAKVVEDARYALAKFRLPSLPPRLAFLMDETEVGWTDAEDRFHGLGASSAIGSADTLLDRIPTEASWLYLPHALGPALAGRIVARRSEHRFGIALASPFALVVAGDDLRRLFLADRTVAVLRPTEVLFVAANPFSPAGHRFDRGTFLEALSATTDLPVIDVMEEN